jgi:hypothetical protein
MFQPLSGGLGIGKVRIRKNVVTATFIVAPETKNAVEVKPTPRFFVAKRSCPVVVVSFFVAAHQPLLRFSRLEGFPLRYTVLATKHMQH